MIASSNLTIFFFSLKKFKRQNLLIESYILLFSYCISHDNSYIHPASEVVITVSTLRFKPFTYDLKSNAKIFLFINVFQINRHFILMILIVIKLVIFLYTIKLLSNLLIVFFFFAKMICK